MPLSRSRFWIFLMHSQ